MGCQSAQCRLASSVITAPCFLSSMSRVSGLGAGESLSSCPRIWKTWRRFPNSYAHRAHSDQTFPLLFLSLLPHFLPSATLMFRNPTPRHKTATRICLEETFPCPSVITPTYLPAAPLLGDVFTLLVRLRPPEMGNVVVIGAVCRYWEGDFVSGGRKRRVLLQSGG